MPKLIIDDREIEVPAGTKVIEAAARLGIMIPRFCYHPALGSVGACRVCAVKILEGPIKGLQMSCMLDAADGMRVSTTDPEAMEFRRYVIEWLMLHHPHDCPVCDEGGHCLLQDMTVSGGHGIRRYPGRKRTYPDQDLGPLVQHEMNRCIHCFRCVRLYQEFCGYRDLGALGIGNRTYFGRAASGRLESPFSGNLSDICPTGVFTDKPSRYVGRRWDYERTPTVCINCSLGCHTVTSVRYRRVVRQEARFSATVNGHFICDRGRFGFFYASLPQRPRQAAVRGETTTVEEALTEARRRMEALPPDAVALIGSPRSSLEALLAAEATARGRGWRGPALFPETEAMHRVGAAVSSLEADLAVSLREVEQADAILAVGADPINEAPMLALAMRQAVRGGGKVVVLDSRPIHLPFEAAHLILAPEALAPALSRLVKLSMASEHPNASAGEFSAGRPRGAEKDPQALVAAAELLTRSQRPVIVCGTDIVFPETVELAARTARQLTTARKKAGLFYLLPAANAFAAARIAPPKATTVEMLRAAAEGDVRCIIFVENDPYATVPNRELLERALDRVEALIVLDYLDSPLSRRADVFIPTQTIYESGGTFINQEGRAQYSPPAFAGGTPVLETGGGDHPPRVYGAGLPGGDPQPAWRLLDRLSDEALPVGRAGQSGLLRRMFGRFIPEAAGKGLDALLEDGLRVAPGGERSARVPSSRPLASAAGPEELEIILVERTFGTEELSSYSACLATLEEKPFAGFSRQDAESLDIREGERVAFPAAGGTLALTARVLDHLATGIVLVPRLRRVAWQALGTRIRRRDIRKA